MAVLLTFTCGVGSVKAGRPPGPNWPGAHSHLPPFHRGPRSSLLPSGLGSWILTYWHFFFSRKLIWDINY